MVEAAVSMAAQVSYAVLIESRESRTAFGFSLVDAIDQARGRTPKECDITVYFVDGTELDIDSKALSRPTVPSEQMRANLVDIARKSLPKVSNPCPPGMCAAKETWERWLSDGPNEDDIQRNQASSAEWLPREEIEAYQNKHLAAHNG